MTGPRRLAVVATHPIQYQVPMYRELAGRPEVDLRVIYGLKPDPGQQGVGFGVAFEWDVSLLDGYEHEVVPNAARDPALEGFLRHSTPSIGTALAAHEPDGVLLTGWHTLSMLQALRACRRLGVPTMIRGESNALRARPWYKRAVHRRLLARYDAFLAIGRANRRFYLDNGVAPERIFDAPYFIDNDRFAEQAESLAEERASLRRMWGVPAGATCFLFVGKLIPKKRVLDLVEATARASDAGENVHLLVVGSGVQEGDARAAAERLGAPVTFAGFLNQTEVSRAYVAGDCLVLPSDYGETWGLVVNEAMASGLPAVVSDRVGCAPDLIREGETGATFPFGDVVALARTMGALAGDEKGLRSMGERAREAVGAYSAATAADGVVDALAFLTAGRP